MRKGLVVQLGGRRRGIVPRALAAENLLDVLICDLLVRESNYRRMKSLPFIGQSITTRLANRVVEIPSKVKIRMCLHHVALNMIRSHWKSDSAAVRQLKLGEVVQDAVRRESLTKGDLLYCYDKAAAHALEIAKEMGANTVLDQTIAPLDQMIDALTAAAAAAGISYEPPPQSYVQLVMSEQELSWRFADTIVCGSDFVKRKLQERGVSNPINVVRPVLVGSQFEKARRLRSWDGRRPLRILTVGQISLRKGSFFAFEAAKTFGRRMNWHFVGSISKEMQKTTKMFSEFISIDGYQRGAELERSFAEADIFVFPSLWEGSAYVIAEAQSLGLPCIITHESGGWIRDGIDGFVLGETSLGSLNSALTRIFEIPSLVAEMSRNALEGSREYNFAQFTKCMRLAVTASRNP